MSVIAAWLVVGGLMGLKTLERRLHSHSAFLMLCITATYLLSVVKSETIFWCLKNYKIAPLSMRNA